MDVIQVPATPKEAFNKHRRISDLIKAQVAHLKHLEEKLPSTQRAALPSHAIVTENDAAQYIAAMTSLIKGESKPATSSKKRVVAIRNTAPIDLAAAAEPDKRSRRAAKKQPKKFAKKKITPRGRR
jgi:ribosomal protein L35